MCSISYTDSYGMMSLSVASRSCSRGGENHDEEILCMAHCNALYVVTTRCRLRSGIARYRYGHEYGPVGEDNTTTRRKYVCAGWLRAAGSDERESTYHRLPSRRCSVGIHTASRADFDGSPAAHRHTISYRPDHRFSDGYAQRHNSARPDPGRKLFNGGAGI